MLKKKINGTWNGVTTLKKKVNGAWSDCSTAKKKISGAWSVVWQRLFLDFEYTSQGVWTDTYSSINLSTTSNDNIRVYIYKKIQLGNNRGARIQTPQLNYTLATGETLYVDYTFNTNGNTACFADFYCGSDIASSSSHFASVNAGSGTVSQTVNDTIATWLMAFAVTNNNYNTNDYYCELLISKIYTDSKVFYWNTETVYNQ